MKIEALFLSVSFFLSSWLLGSNAIRMCAILSNTFWAVIHVIKSALQLSE